jgi:hypothetical protein
MEFMFVVVLFVSTLYPFGVAAENSSTKNTKQNINSSVKQGEECSPCVLILFLYDLNQQWHVMRAATYSSLTTCISAGKQVQTDMQRVVGSKLQNTTDYYCLKADLPN